MRLNSVGRLLFCFAILGLVGGACSNKRENGSKIDKRMDYGMADTQSDRSQTFDYDKECAMKKRVRAPAKGSPEFVVKQLFTHWKEGMASGWRGEKNGLFASWTGLFPKGTNSMSLRDTLSTLMKPKKMALYMTGKDAKRVVFTLCEKRMGDNEARLVIWKNSKKTNPPIRLIRDDAESPWKLEPGFRL